jgi:hypothetical protein
MDDMRRTGVTELHERRVSRAVAARRRLDRAPFPAHGGEERTRPVGRAWVNGVELGGTDPRHATLSVAYD